jgi:glutamyl-tRNA reductase
MHIVVVGLNHETAPIEAREQTSLSASAIVTVQNELRGQPGMHEVTILSTCNRTEIYTVSVCASGGEAASRSLLSAGAPYLYVYRDDEAVEHLFRVAAGIDSAILGETQVLGQVGAAFELAHQGGVTGGILSTLFQQAVHAGKRARTETAISRNTLSPSHAAVALARGKLASLADRNVVLIGTGAMASSAADALRNDGIAKLTVVSRDVYRAAGKAADWMTSFRHVEAIALADVAEAVASADLVVAATTSSDPILTVDVVARRTSAEVLVVLDMGVPRNVEAAVRGLPGVLHFDIDDLNEVVESNLAERRREIAPVERIVKEEVESFLAWFQALWIQPLLIDLRSRAEAIRSGELDRALRRLASLSPQQREIVESLTQTIVSKLLHEPTIRLKQYATESRGYLFAEALRDLFNLEQQP